MTVSTLGSLVEPGASGLYQDVFLTLFVFSLLGWWMLRPLLTSPAEYLPRFSDSFELVKRVCIFVAVALVPLGFLTAAAYWLFHQDDGTTAFLEIFTVPLGAPIVMGLLYLQVISLLNISLNSAVLDWYRREEAALAEPHHQFVKYWLQRFALLHRPLFFIRGATFREVCERMEMPDSDRP